VFDCARRLTRWPATVPEIVKAPVDLRRTTFSAIRAFPSAGASFIAGIMALGWQGFSAIISPSRRSDLFDERGL